MGFLNLTKFFVLAGTTGAITTVAVKALPTTLSASTLNKPNLPTTSKNFLSSSRRCYMVATEPFDKEKLLACNDGNYYLHKSDDDSLTKLKDLKKAEESQVSSTLAKKANEGEQRIWKVTDREWNKLTKDTSLTLDDRSNPNGYCDLSHVLSGAQMEMGLLCQPKGRGNTLVTIKLIPFA